jgi:nitroreductase
MHALDSTALDQLFHKARTVNGFTPDAVTDEQLQALYDIFKWGPTSMNCQPARFVFLKSAAAKQRLKPALMEGNIVKTLSAPVCAIVAMDTQFYEHLPTQWLAKGDAKKMFEDKPAFAEAAATLNATLSGGYLIMAARAVGLSCGPMGGFDKKKVDAEFFPDGRFKSLFLCNLGVGDFDKTHPRGPRLAFDVACSIV